MRKQSPYHLLKLRLSKGLLTFVLGFAIMLVIVTTTAIFWLRTQAAKTEFTDQTTVRQFVIGNDVLNIPLNLMRFEAQRNSTVLNQIDLAIDWPSGEGFAAPVASSFLNADQISNLIFIALTKRTMPADMSARFGPIYSKIMTGPERQGPAGLLLKDLQAGTGYDGEELAYINRPGETWVARCQMTDQSVYPTCLRDIQFGKSLSVRFRFSREHLENWRDIDAMIVQLMSRIIGS